MWTDIMPKVFEPMHFEARLADFVNEYDEILGKLTPNNIEESKEEIKNAGKKANADEIDFIESEEILDSPLLKGVFVKKLSFESPHAENAKGKIGMVVDYKNLRKCRIAYGTVVLRNDEEEFKGGLNRWMERWSKRDARKFLAYTINWDWGLSLIFTPEIEFGYFEGKLKDNGFKATYGGYEKENE